MGKKFIKNIEFNKSLEMGNLVEYQAGRVVSLTLVQNEGLSLTLFAFAKGEGVSIHSTHGDAMVYMIDGEAEVNIGSETLIAHTGQTVIMPSDIPHGLTATENFKMMLIVVKE